MTGKFDSVEEFANLIVAERGGRPIYLPEVAQVVDGIEESRSSALINDSPGLALDVVKQSGANTVEMADGVREAVAQLNSELPPHIRLREVVDNSVFIRDSVEDVQVTLVLGGLLAVLIVFLFLNSWRSTVITGLALPVSVVGAFIIMNALGFTLNVLTLMGLSLAIGLLIDDAIVVRENIVRHMHAGADHYTAAREATAEIGLAVMATTFTIIAVFIPVAFMGGIIGRFFYQFRHHGRFRGAHLPVRELHAGSDAVIEMVRPGGRPHGAAVLAGAPAGRFQRASGPASVRSGRGAQMVVVPPVGGDRDRVGRDRL